MNVRKNRLQSIISILKTQVISNQDELQRALVVEGIIITQATLSRDLKYLNVVKTAQYDGTYKYVITDATIPSEEKNQDNFSNKATRGAILEIAFSGTLAVVKTRPGYANAVAYDIDMHGSELILGTIAGDDTVLIIPREGHAREAIEEFLQNLK